MDWPSFACGVVFALVLIAGSIAVALVLLIATGPKLFPDEYSRSIEDDYERSV